MQKCRILHKTTAFKQTKIKLKIKKGEKMSLKIKLMSMISAFVLVLSMLLVGVLAATQTINLKGTVSFNITDNTLYIKDIRIQTELGLV